MREKREEKKEGGRERMEERKLGEREGTGRDGKGRPVISSSIAPS